MTAYHFKPAWWLPGPHLQTIWPTFFRRHLHKLSVRRERFELPDGDFIDLDWTGGKTGPIVILLHGLEGSILSPYAKGMLHAITEQGWRGVFMHFRGCSEELNRMPRTYHSGDTDDVALIVETLFERENKPPMAVIGFSLGGNVLLKWLGQSGKHNPLKAAVAISVPFELDKAAEYVKHGFSRFYQWYLLKAMRKKALAKFKHRSLPIAARHYAELKTLYDFDDKVTAPLHGFSSADEYYLSASSRQYLKSIQTPTLLLQAKDDPFMPSDVIPNKFELSPHVSLEVSRGGGHVGFVSGKFPWQAEYWLEKRVPVFLRNFL